MRETTPNFLLHHFNHGNGNYASFYNIGRLLIEIDQIIVADVFDLFTDHLDHLYFILGRRGSTICRKLQILLLGPHHLS